MTTQDSQEEQRVLKARITYQDDQEKVISWKLPHQSTDILAGSGIIYSGTQKIRGWTYPSYTYKGELLKQIDILLCLEN